MFQWDFCLYKKDERRLYKTYHKQSNHNPHTQTITAPRREYEVLSLDTIGAKKTMDIPNVSQLPPLNISLSDAFLQRRTSWHFSDVEMGKEMLQSLLGYSFGMSSPKDRKRTYASGGQFYPIEIYFVPTRRTVANGVLEEKVYKFNVDRNEIVEMKDIDVDSLHKVSAQTDVGYFSFDEAQIIVFLVANDQDISVKYMDFSYRLLLLEAGHMAQNFQLTCTALGLSSVPMGGFHEVVVHQLLGIEDHSYMTVYTLLGG
ncbi:SagB/ThcOx family dehydrogenase [Bacillus aquiflavi]|uniref:SagB/ThcOx family dehydrogenase n=1 Tax=Bacillus aquiflavi TaxID=2672567 RepID=A0A6B3VZ81_9BACI|nr:SagB/ThcOx family dehydrogenase [Bacillus aquiflavi]MBA4536695.1 SagB/ThcOx family dehydrogenase [Bacillus aquiflavi]NEY81063.1 SagB/ThcOx family dehydrogenase [Bacillus aquiflavi]UAC48731.1 SagB/ThcOx family dehydrogenase [Bacillus aquiflavi]